MTSKTTHTVLEKQYLWYIISYMLARTRTNECTLYKSEYNFYDKIQN